MEIDASSQEGNEESQSSQRSRWIVNKAMAGVRYLVGFNLLTKLITYILNILIIRAVSPAEYGVSRQEL